MAYNKVYRPVVGLLKRKTEKAILLVVTDDEAIVEEDSKIEVWIPTSQILKMTPIEGNMEVMLTEWIIGQKDLKRFVSKTPAAPTSAPLPVHPPAPTTPPTNHWADMDDDIPY